MDHHQTPLPRPVLDNVNDIPMAAFSEAVRENILALLAGILMMAISGWLVSYFRYHRPSPRRDDVQVNLTRSDDLRDDNDAFQSPYQKEAERRVVVCESDEEDELTESSLGVLFCCLGLATALGNLAIVPTTAALSWWMGPSILHRFWNYSSIAASFSLYALMPFCYFFLEANGTRWSSKTKESLKVLALFWLLVASLIYIMTRSLGVGELLESHPWLSALNIFTSIPGGIAALFAVPRGIVYMYHWTAQWTIPLNHREQIRNLITEKEFEIMALDNKLHDGQQQQRPESVLLRRRSAQQQQPPQENLEEIARKISILRKDIKSLHRSANAHPLVRIILVSLAYLLTTAGLVGALMKLVSRLFHSVATHRAPSSSPKMALFWWTLLEPVAVLFFTLTAVIGFFRLTPRLGLSPRKTTARHLIGSIMLLLAVSIILPIVTQSLGISTFEPGLTVELGFLHTRSWILPVYRVVMIWSIISMGRTLH
ncbi:hypothetical protein DFS34DRAFT_696401 [Phlyctochytrium arcticum]|nr:hypothetical protein DFS34DRAFT_696401 [Phlyctochytrium arcticum]